MVHIPKSRRWMRRDKGSREVVKQRCGEQAEMARWPVPQELELPEIEGGGVEPRESGNEKRSPVASGVANSMGRPPCLNTK